jgi:DNA-binding XRE family transcriptional regulator
LLRYARNDETDLFSVSLNEVLAALPPKRRAKVEQRAGELATLKDLRLAVEHTQQDLAASLGVGQDTISRIERRSDLLLSTLRRYIQAMGGELDLVARFPNRPPVLLDHIAQKPAAKGRAASTKKTGSRGKAIA